MKFYFSLNILRNSVRSVPCCQLKFGFSAVANRAGLHAWQDSQMNVNKNKSTSRMITLYPCDTKVFLHCRNEKFSEDLEMHQKSYLVLGILQLA